MGKISRGTIEIVNDVQLLKEGDKVGASEATLLNMLNISPFTYGLQVQQVYDQGTVFSPKVLDITDEDLMITFQSGLANVAAVSLAIGSVTDVTFKEAATLKEYLADPSKFAVAAAPTAAATEAAPAAAKEEEPEEESDDDMGFGLFD